tara:strand:- start:549 stop:746 length:198 start_codon:yes stop_codon:yes gene_type:complete
MFPLTIKKFISSLIIFHNQKKHTLDFSLKGHILMMQVPLGLAYINRDKLYVISIVAKEDYYVKFY